MYPIKIHVIKTTNIFNRINRQKRSIQSNHKTKTIQNSETITTNITRPHLTKTSQLSVEISNNSNVRDDNSILQSESDNGPHELFNSARIFRHGILQIRHNTPRGTGPGRGFAYNPPPLSCGQEAVSLTSSAGISSDNFRTWETQSRYLRRASRLRDISQSTRNPFVLIGRTASIELKALRDVFVLGVISFGTWTGVVPQSFCS